MRDQMLGGLFGLSGQVAIVTGALGRLGREYVRVLAQAGAAVGAIDLAGDAETFVELPAGAGRVHVELADLTRKADADHAVARIAGVLGPPTILINNAG